jgi:hypothetical protein
LVERAAVVNENRVMIEFIGMDFVLHQERRMRLPASIVVATGLVFNVALLAGRLPDSAQPVGQSGGQQTAGATKACEPSFETTEYSRGVPYVFVDQGLESLPHVYPKRVLLVQRRYSELGAVRYSLLVYRQDAAKPDVTVEGMAVHDTQAWLFTAHCSTDNVMDGIVTTLERIAKLSDSRVRQP